MLSNSSTTGDQQERLIYSQTLVDRNGENEYEQKSIVKGRKWKEQKSEELAVTASVHLSPIDEQQKLCTRAVACNSIFAPKSGGLLGGFADLRQA